MTLQNHLLIVQIISSSREDQVDAGEVTEVIEVDRVTDMVRDEVEDITIGEVTGETGAETVVETEAGTVMVTEVETDMTRLLVTVMDLRGEVDVVDLEVVVSYAKFNTVLHCKSLWTQPHYLKAVGDMTLNIKHCFGQRSRTNLTSFDNLYWLFY